MEYLVDVIQATLNKNQHQAKTQDHLFRKLNHGAISDTK